jgi:hypothetical protein
LSVPKVTITAAGVPASAQPGKVGRGEHHLVMARHGGAHRGRPVVATPA